MTAERQRLIDAIELVNALASREGTVDEASITPALEAAREEMRKACAAYVAAVKP